MPTDTTPDNRRCYLCGRLWRPFVEHPRFGWICRDEHDDYKWEIINADT